MDEIMKAYTHWMVINGNRPRISPDIFEAGFRAGYEAAIKSEPAKMVVTTEELERLKRDFDLH